ncbi:hypothetical protein SmphiM6_7 [Sinorhizobium phage phiM6]|nr:hypothetical protein SmphiM6_7 [Sinorhizobium phage phiM6]
MPKGTKRPYTAEQRRKSVEREAEKAFAIGNAAHDRVGKGGFVNAIADTYVGMKEHSKGRELSAKAKSMNQAKGAKKDAIYMGGGKVEGFESPVKEKARKAGKDFPFFKHSTKGK